MRGKVKTVQVIQLDRRITPAYAGKSVQRSKYFNSIRDHPRLCGEKSIEGQRRVCEEGSPPPMRGKDEFHMKNDDELRITPAYAGKSRPHITSGEPSWDHPRLCGEKVRQCLTSYGGQGSPPPMRGKANANFNRLPASRITPAYAGKRLPDTERGRATRDHPRLCGEKGIVKTCNIVRIGSPPPMRGKAGSTKADLEKRGITPAYAGKSRRPVQI